MIIIVDFGSQTTHLIARRLKEFGVGVKIVNPENAMAKINRFKAGGVILSGGPSSVYGKNAQTVDRKSVFSLGIPVLGICYGSTINRTLVGG
jgi:GMP synthase (glutamine-hydrolysing)